MANNRKILVIGAPGNVGTEVVKGLIAANVPFRVGARDVDRARQVLIGAPEIVAFDFLNPATFTAAFANIDKLFLVRPPALGNVPRDIAPALTAAKAAGVTQVVFVSIQGVEHNKRVPHYKIEMLIRALGFDYTFLRASFFMQNFTTTHRTELQQRSEIALPVGKAKTSFIDTRDIGAVATRTLIDPGHTNQAYTLTGSEALDYYQVAALLSDVLKRPIRYTNPSPVRFIVEQLGLKRPIDMVLVMTMLYTITRFGNATEVTDDVQRILQRPPITFRQFATDFRDLWLSDSKT